MVGGDSQHRVSSFSLLDRTRPGHRRFVALWLVDPHQRIISTANVPPQRADWWAEAVLGSGKSTVNRGEMPPELFQLLREQGGALANEITAVDGGGQGGSSGGEDQEVRGKGARLPPEIVDMVRREGVLPDGIMTPDEARQHRLALMRERTAFREDNERDWTSTGYSFCEH